MNKKKDKIDTPLISIENNRMESIAKESETSKNGYKERELTNARKNMKR